MIWILILYPELLGGWKIGLKKETKKIQKIGLKIWNFSNTKNNKSGEYKVTQQATTNILIIFTHGICCFVYLALTLAL